MGRLVYVPIDLARARSMRAGVAPGVVAGCALTAELAAEAGVSVGAEDAEYVALEQAGILALAGAADGRRFVIAADVDPAQVADRDARLGEVEITALRWAHVIALFADDLEAREAVAAAGRAVAGLGLDDAAQLPEVAALTSSWDLLWFDPGELDLLAQ